MDDCGKFKIYQSSGEPKQPYFLYKDLPTSPDMDEPWSAQLKRLENEPFFPISGAYIQGDYIIYATQGKQLLKMRHVSEKIDEIGKFSFLISPFHSQAISGIQTCLKRQIIVTSGIDRSLRVWSYNNTSSNILKLEICETTFDEVLALALHASGNYFVASFNAFVRCFNIFPKEIKHYLELPIKTCKEMKFSQYGNLLACQRANQVVLVNFFTGVLAENYVFTWHKANVRSISWLEDDIGFVSSAADNTIAVWLLPRI